MVALPAARPSSLAPCSIPHPHVGREPNTPRRRRSPPAQRTDMWVARCSSSSPPGCHSHTWASAGGRSLFLANSIGPALAAGVAHSRSHMGEVSYAPGPMAHPEHRYRVGPGEKVDLSTRPTDDAGAAPGDKLATNEATQALVARIADLQARLWAESDRRVLVVLQGIDTSG